MATPAIGLSLEELASTLRIKKEGTKRSITLRCDCEGCSKSGLQGYIEPNAAITMQLPNGEVTIHILDVLTAANLLTAFHMEIELHLLKELTGTLDTIMGRTDAN